MTDRVRAAQEALLSGAAFTNGGAFPNGGASPSGPASVVRPVVLESWTRSRSFGVDPDATLPPIDLADDELNAYRQRHPLHAVLPVVRELLVTHATADDLIVAVSDAAGLLLWVEGHPGLRRRAESMRFTAGARWDERHAGTNAPGLALALGADARVAASEHWARSVRPWSCSAVPVHDPVDGTVLGALDVTGDERAASRGVLALVRATVAAVERELRLRQRGPAAQAGASRGPGGGGGPGDDGRMRLSVLGPDGPTLSIAGRRVHLSLRHAELLVLLAERPDGATAQQLAVLLDERALDDTTVRAELFRLRRVLGPGPLRSRPYRLAAGALATDVDAVRRALAAGDPGAALDLWPAPMLARSASPGVAAVRARLKEEVRVALIRHGDPALLLRWVDGPVGADDLALWRVCRDLLPTGPNRDHATARVHLLDQEFG